jgi:hypothetical protein
MNIVKKEPDSDSETLPTEAQNQQIDPPRDYLPATVTFIAVKTEVEVSM